MHEGNISLYHNIVIYHMLVIVILNGVHLELPQSAGARITKEKALQLNLIIRITDI